MNEILRAWPAGSGQLSPGFFRVPINLKVYVEVRIFSWNFPEKMIENLRESEIIRSVNSESSGGDY